MKEGRGRSVVVSLTQSVNSVKEEASFSDMIKLTEELFCFFISFTVNVVHEVESIGEEK